MSKVEEAATEETVQAPPAGRHRGRSVLVGLAILVAAAGVGTGAYFVGKSTGEDLAAARAAGEVAGAKRGAAIGTKRGFAKGFKTGRDEGYQKAYEKSYRQAYGEAFKQADLEPPEKIEVPEGG